jgi:hypothetical protein
MSVYRCCCCNTMLLVHSFACSHCRHLLAGLTPASLGVLMLHHHLVHVAIPHLCLLQVERQTRQDDPQPGIGVYDWYVVQYVLVPTWFGFLSASGRHMR